MPNKLTRRQCEVLEAVPLVQPSSSADIAESIGEQTHWIASTLKALERKGLIVCTKRGGLGLPSKFRVTDAGRLALSDSKENGK